MKLVAREEPSADGDNVFEPRDPAMIMYTSGTTSDPKGCVISHDSLVRTGRIFGTERFPMRRRGRCRHAPSRSPPLT
jgi:long-subunit acyl-CoA synthetase (AMP-forming)